MNEIFIEKILNKFERKNKIKSADPHQIMAANHGLPCGSRQCYSQDCAANRLTNQLQLLCQQMHQRSPIQPRCYHVTWRAMSRLSAADGCRC